MEIDFEGLIEEFREILNKPNEDTPDDNFICYKINPKILKEKSKIGYNQMLSEKYNSRKSLLKRFNNRRVKIDIDNR